MCKNSRSKLSILKCLPKWKRQTRTTPVERKSESNKSPELPLFLFFNLFPGKQCTIYFKQNKELFCEINTELGTSSSTFQTLIDDELKIESKHFWHCFVFRNKHSKLSILFEFFQQFDANTCLSNAKSYRILTEKLKPLKVLRKTRTLCRKSQKKASRRRVRLIATLWRHTLNYTCIVCLHMYIIQFILHLCISLMYEGVASEIKTQYTCLTKLAFYLNSCFLSLFSWPLSETSSKNQAFFEKLF